LRNIKSNGRRRQRQANDNGSGNGNGNGNGYDLLQGEWLAYYQVGKGFERRVRPEDREDFLHDLFLKFAKVKASYDGKGRELTEGGLVRIAQYEVAQYWRKWFKHINGMDCGRCSKAQRQKCKEQHLYRECPKAIRTESLDTVIEDGNGDSTPLYELIADDTAVDVAARLDARLVLQSYPHRFVQLAYKKYAGYSLDSTERDYFYRQVKKAQKLLAI